MPKSTASSSSTTLHPVHFFDDFLKFGSNATPEEHKENPEVVMPDSKYTEYFDHVENLAVRLHESGFLEKCVSLVPGDDGFMVAQWLDGSETMTEAPILPTTSTVFKKPAAVFKKPAAVLVVDPVDGDVVPIDRDERAPYGCSRCRWKVGCTPSCWVRRKGKDPVSSS